MTTTAAHRQRGFLRSLLTLLTLLGAIGFGPAVDASASTGGAAETRVRAFDTPTAMLAGRVDAASSTTVRVSSVPLRQQLSATGVATNSVRSPLRDIPADANIRVLKPDPTGGAQYGVEYKWVNTDGQTVRFRVHGPDGHAPVGSNAAVGDTYRVQVGKRYMDADGNLYPSGVHNPLSPNYDPDAANATHIPWPGLSWPG